MSYALALTNPGSDLDRYLSQVYSIPVLTREEELELTQEFFKTEDVQIAHKLVISHLRFVVHIAKSYAGYVCLDKLHRKLNKIRRLFSMTFRSQVQSAQPRTVFKNEKAPKS